MRADDVVKVKGFFLIVIIAAFVTMDLGGEVTGAKPPKCPAKSLPGNYEEPITVYMKKTLISGDRRVPIETLAYWELEIVVCYDDEVTITDVEVRDRIPPQLVLINTTPSKGWVDTWANKEGSTQMRWHIGTMEPGGPPRGVPETLMMTVATDEGEFKKPRKYELNSGAKVFFNYNGTEYASLRTDPIKVTAYKPKKAEVEAEEEEEED